MKIFRVSIPCLSYHSQWSLTSPCGLVSTWVRTSEIREWMWTGKNPFVTYHPALPKGRIQFYYTNLYSAKKKGQQKKASLKAVYTSGKEACMLFDHQWETGPLKKTLWIHTVRLSAVEVQVSTPTALHQHLPCLHSAVQLKCFFSLWKPLTISWFRVHGCWWESLGPRTHYLYNSCWFSSDKIRLSDDANLWSSN